MAHLSLSFLGPFQVRLAGKLVTRFESNKVRALLAHLAVEAERPHAREVLAGLLWPDWPDRSARSNLRNTLSKLRNTIDDRYATPPFLLITRETIQFNKASDHWLDVTAFTEPLEADRAFPDVRHLLEEAVDLYRGGFMEGFSLRDSPAFEDWLLLTRERLQRQALMVLCRLAEHYEETGEYERACEYAHRQVELVPWHEEAHYQLIRLLALSGRRGAALAQFKACCRLLSEELAVEPAPETIRLYEEIRDGEIQVPEVRSSPLIDVLTLPPAFVDVEDDVEAERPVFVARERELQRLAGFFEESLEGNGRVVFVTGGPGLGKTALIDEFARRAMEKNPNLLVVSGNCNAYSGIGDPYLPFREAMDLLTGDLESRWAAGTITVRQAQRLWAAIPLTAQTLIENGPHLFDIFVPSSSLLSYARAASSGETNWLPRLEQLIERRQSRPDGIQQSHLFQQITNVLCVLSEEHPLLLVLDDFQWADSASISLLFHLGLRLEGSRILIIIAYRPEEVALGRDGARPGERVRHPLGKVLAEFKRRFGDAWVDLGKAEEIESRIFVDAFLDTEPNQLSEAFRDALFRHTEGHPLFMVELLRAMQERGDLVQDQNERWVEGPVLDWETMPPRVEGVIEERIARLEAELRDILIVASVEGEEFTAQVVARVKETSERQLLRSLSQELEKRHRLVREQGELAVDHLRLSRYRFAHTLFQQYLHSYLGEGERRLLHREVGKVLEELYRERADEIATQLVHHFASGGDAERERHYARVSGERAAAGYANDEALRLFSRSLELVPESDITERFGLLLAREKVYDVQGDREAQIKDLEELERLANALNEDRRKAEVALRRASYAESIGNYPAANAAAQAAVLLGKSAQSVDLEAAGYLEWGRSLLRQTKYDSARSRLEKALNLARAVGSGNLQANSLRGLGIVSTEQVDLPGARTYYEQALAIARDIGDRHGESATLNNLGLVCWHQSDYVGAKAYYEQALRAFREMGDRYGEGTSLSNLGMVLAHQGDYVRARDCYEQSLNIRRDIDDRLGEGLALVNLGFVSGDLGDHERAKVYAEQALRIGREIGNRRVEAIALTQLGWVSVDTGSFAGANACFEQGLQICRDIGDRRGEGHALRGLGYAFLAQGAYHEAGSLLEQALRIFPQIGARGDEGWALTDLGLLYHHLGDDNASLEHSQQALLIGQELGDNSCVGRALTYLGHALVGQAKLDEAADVYRQALDLRREMNQPHLATEPLAGVARVTLTKDEPAQALICVEEILEFLEYGSLDGTEEPLGIYLTCYRVLRANQDPRAGEILDTAYALLQERAAKIDDEELQRSFLENVAAHREIVEAYAELR